MLALEEKPRTVVLLQPTLVLEGKNQEILQRFDDNYLEVKARKQVYLNKIDAEFFFQHLPQDELESAIDGASRGLSEVIVLEHLDGDAIKRTSGLVEEFLAEFGAGSIYCSSGPWEFMRDLEYFFPHLDAAPVERTLAVIKPEAVSRGAIRGVTLEEEVQAELAAKGLFIVGNRRAVLSAAEAQVLCEDLKGTSDHQPSISALTSEPGSIVLCVEGPGAIGKWLLLSGPRNSGYAREKAPATLRARWGTDSASNALHASSDMAAADHELEALFPEGELKLQRTLCIVKPDAMVVLPKLRAAMEEAGFTVLREKEAKLTKDQAAEFYRDHKGKPYFNALLKEASSGPCVIMVLCRLEAVSVLQQLAGPEVVKEAKRTRPNSLRSRFGSDGQRNALHCSDSAKSAGREVRFFFPELGVDPVPDDDEIKDFLFRKSAAASMDLKTLSDTDSSSFTLDPTLQQLISKGLLEMCQVQPKGLSAVKWLSRWLAENNPNKKQSGGSTAVKPFNPPERTKRFIEYSVNPDGLPFVVEAPPAAATKKVIDVDVSGEADEQRIADSGPAPHIVFVLGGPGSGKGTQCAKLKEEFNFVHLRLGDLMHAEVKAETFLGTEIGKHMRAGNPVPNNIALQLLRKNILKHQDTNRFLVDGFPRTVEQAKQFEQEIAEASFILYLQAETETMRMRIDKRREAAPGRVDDAPKTVEQRLEAFTQQTMTVVDYYKPIGKVRRVDAEKEADEVYTEAKQYFGCRFVYLLGPPGAPSAQVASRLEEKYGYACINLTTLLQAYATSGEADAEKVKQCLAKGEPCEASIACPLVLSEIYRDMALGVHNFVIVDFPQSLKQAQFLEYRVPCVTKPVHLDFSRADAEDLAATKAGDALELEMRTAMFFSDAAAEMRKSLPGLIRVPCNLAEIDSDDEQRLVDATWARVCEQVMPGLTIVLGPPRSGTKELAQKIAALTPNTQAVDCDDMLDRELERKTDIGVTMHNMLARGQVVPLSMTLQLLKNIVNLTCSDSLVIENCPQYVDQIEHITKEFRIDRVYYIRGSAAAMDAWKKEHVAACKGEDSTKEARAFDERVMRLEPIVSHVSRLGKLERLDVNETPKPAKLERFVEMAIMPRFAIITGLSAVSTPAQADKLASAFGAGPALTIEAIVKFADEKLKRTLDPADPSRVFNALQQYADTNGQGLLVLDRYPKTAEDAAAFLGHFGDPVVMLNLDVEDEPLAEEIEAAAQEREEDVPEREELLETIGKMRAPYEAVVKVFEEKCPAAVMSVKWALVKSPDELAVSVQRRLLPRVYAVVAPSGATDFSALVTDAVSTCRREGQSAMKFMTLDYCALFNTGMHSATIEDRLRKAALGAERSPLPMAAPTELRAAVLREAFSRSANPMGAFLVTNFPVQGSAMSGQTIRDQFEVLGSVASLMGILCLDLSRGAYMSYCSELEEDWLEYAAFKEEVRDQIRVQFDASRVKECTVEDKGTPAEAAKLVADAFLAFYEKAGQPKRT